MAPEGKSAISPTLQVTVDCTDPGRMTAFWATALGYEKAPPPQGHATWNDFYRAIGVPDDELDFDGDGGDRLIDPAGRGPRIWFQVVPEKKTIKNRLHFDLGVSAGRAVPVAERKLAVDAEADRLVGAGATLLRVLADEDVDHYGVVLQDPEGNEFCVH